MFNRIEDYLDSRKEHAYIFLRLAIGWRLIDGTEDNVFSWDRMLEFRNFLDGHGVPYPLIAANISVWAQFICGLMILTGAFIRPAAAVMVVNFLAALFIAHIGLSFEQSFDAFMMLFGSAFFFVAGAGRFSIDDLRRRKPDYLK